MPSKTTVSGNTRTTRSSVEKLVPIPGESFYVELDNDTNCYGVFGSDSGFCYDLFTTREEAEANCPVVHAIEVTQYSRPDKRSTSRVTAHKTLEGDWMVYCQYGPSWAWNDETRDWDITTVGGFPYKSPVYRMTEERAKEVLRTVVSKQEADTRFP